MFIQLINWRTTMNYARGWECEVLVHLTIHRPMALCRYWMGQYRCYLFSILEWVRYDIKLLLLAEQLYYAHECHICISRYLNKMVVDHHTQLDQYLQTTMLSLRAKKQLTTKYIPYFLMCGREVRYHNTLTIHSLSGCVWVCERDTDTTTHDLSQVT